MTSERRQPNVVVLGGGSWGTTVASICSRRVPTLQWVRSPETADDINKNHRNSAYLGDEVELSETLRATTHPGLQLVLVGMLGWDNRAIVRAASAASKAADFLLAFGRAEEEALDLARGARRVRPQAREASDALVTAYGH